MVNLLNMPKTLIKKIESINGLSPTDQKKFAYKQLVNSGMPARMAKTVLGYSSKTNESSKITIDQQREQALQDLNITIRSQFATLLDIRDDKQSSCASDRINAVKTINSMVPGFAAPAEVNVNNTAVMYEFRKSPSAELIQLAHDLKVALQPDLQDTDIDDAEFEVLENGI